MEWCRLDRHFLSTDLSTGLCVCFRIRVCCYGNNACFLVVNIGLHIYTSCHHVFWTVIRFPSDGCGLVKLVKTLRINQWKTLSKKFEQPWFFFHFFVWKQWIMMTSSNKKIRVTGPLCGEFTGDRWIPLTKVSDAELWFFSLIWAWITVE